MPETELIVLLGSDWATLDTASTRWRFLAPRFLELGLVSRLALVDFPHFRRRAALDRGYPLAARRPAGPARLSSIDLTIPLGSRPTPGEALGWRRAARALEALLPNSWQSLQVVDRGSSRRVALATNPLWVPLLAHLTAHHRGFDADDDWRFHPQTASLQRRVIAGYKLARTLESVTANSAVLADRLRCAFGVTATHIGNGVDLSAFSAPGPPPQGLPDRPFAVYVGNLQSRVDLGMLEEIARHLAPEMSVVIAGPAEKAIADRLSAGRLRWLGPLPHQQVPGLLSAARVGLIPHFVDNFTSSMEPLKLLEYLAADLPVVATPLPGLSGFSGAVTVAPDALRMAEATRQLAFGHRPGLARQLVADRDWDAVARRVASAHLSSPEHRPA